MRCFCHVKDHNSSRLQISQIKITDFAVFIYDMKRIKATRGRKRDLNMYWDLCYLDLVVVVGTIIYPTIQVFNTPWLKI